MSSKMTPKVLIAPLDWGLGHATRCIPVIRKLIDLGADVTICASGGGKALLKNRFPSLDMIGIPSYQVTYPKDGSMAWSMMLQTIPLVRSIRNEHEILEKLVEEFRFTHIISDNRYGIYSSRAKCAIITHQLNIMTPNHLKVFRPMINGLVNKYVSRFEECWIPDNDSMLSGMLSVAPQGSSVTFRNIGILSRFQHADLKKSSSEFEVVAVISGPEPQRTLLSDLIIKNYSGKMTRVLIAGGQPGPEDETSVSGNITLRNDISDNELASALNENTLYIGRSGYSTIMDLVALRHRKVVLIPTPGQTEQEYLASYLHEQYGTVVSYQNDLRIPDQVNPSDWPAEDEDDQQLDRAMREFLSC